MTELFFERPTQVMFPDFDDDSRESWLVGIAYKTEIICACCGGVFTVAEVMDCANECGYKEAIYPFSTWESLVDAINSNALPEGLTVNEVYNIVEASE